MQQPDAFRRFACGLHQDIGLEADSFEALARVLLGGVDAAQHPALRRYVDHLRATPTAAEIKGVLNRASPEVRFNTQGAAALLRAAAEQLAAERA